MWKEHNKEKLGHKCDFVDHKARNVLAMKDVTPSVIKCMRRFNHYGLRDALINNNMVEEICSRCNNIETWDYVVKYPHTLEIREKFIETLLAKLLKKKLENVDANLIMAYCEDILRHLEEDIDDECETTQHCMGMKETFRGHIVKD